MDYDYICDCARSNLRHDGLGVQCPGWNRFRRADGDYLGRYSRATLGTIADIYSLVPDFTISFPVIMMVSLVTKPPQENITEEFEKAAKSLVE